MSPGARRTPLNGRVMVVDDEPALLHGYARTLAEAGFEVATAAGGSDALQSVGRHQFDLVMVDASIPELDGITLLRRLKAQADLPVILMLDKPDNLAFVQASESGALQTLVKPIAPDVLKMAAASAIQRHRARSPVLRSPARTVFVTATEGKNEFGHMLERAIQGNEVFITKHDTPKAVLISVDEFNALSQAGRAHLQTLSDEFDALLAQMQTPAARRAMMAAFSASPKEMGRAAVALASRRGK